MKAIFDYGEFIKDFVDPETFDVYEIKIVNKEGVIVATSESDTSKINNNRIKLTGLSSFGSILSGDDYGFVYETDEDEEDVLTGYAISDDVNEHIVLASKKSEVVLSPINTFVENLKASINDYGSSIRSSTILIAGGIGGISLVIGYFMINRFTKPLTLLVSDAKIVTEGKLNHEFEAKEKDDEIGEVIHAIKEMVNSTASLIRNVRGASDEVVAMSQELSSTTQQVNASMQQVASATQQIANGAAQLSTLSQESSNNANQLAAVL